jgi:hypothetical protein
MCRMKRVTLCLRPSGLRAVERVADRATQTYGQLAERAILVLSNVPSVPAPRKRGAGG